MEKIKSGIFGLNSLMDGGINKNSATVVIGAAGAGKTTFATQFVRRGLEQGQLGIFVSLDENKEQIIQEAYAMGWTEIHDYLNDDLLIFIDASGKEFSTFIHKELPSFVDEWTGSDTRLVIDPLTPVVWSTEDRYEQREMMAFLLKETRKIGTVLCTLEEHGTIGDLSGRESVIPMYLADSVIHLRHSAPGHQAGRTLRIIKCRSSRHSRKEHPYKIIEGLGIMIQQLESRENLGRELTINLKNEIQASGSISAPIKKRITSILDNLRDQDFEGLDRKSVIENIMEEYGD